MQIQRIVLTLFVAALLSSCAGSRYAEGQKYERLRDYRGEDFGYVVVSVGMLKSAPYTSASLGFVEIATGSPGSFPYAPKLLIGDRTPRDFDFPESEGTVLAKRLPPGNYEIRGASGLWFAGSYTVSKSLRLGQPLAFTIVAGQTAYLGRYVVGEDGNAVSGTASLAATDEQSRDLTIAKTRVPNLDPAEIHSFARVAKYGQP